MILKPMISTTPMVGLIHKQQFWTSYKKNGLVDLLKDNNGMKEKNNCQIEVAPRKGSKLTWTITDDIKIEDCPTPSESEFHNIGIRTFVAMLLFVQTEKIKGLPFSIWQFTYGLEIGGYNWNK